MNQFVTHGGMLEFPHLMMGAVLLVAAGVALGESLSSTEETGTRLALPLTLVVGGLGVVFLAIAENWWWHGGEYTSRTRLRAPVGAVLVAAGLAQLWGRRRGLRRTELAPPFALMFAGLVSALRETGADDERLLHAAVAGLVLISTLATLAAILSGEPARPLRIFAHLVLATAAIGLLLFEPGSPGAEKPRILPSTTD